MPASVPAPAPTLASKTSATPPISVLAGPPTVADCDALAPKPPSTGEQEKVVDPAQRARLAQIRDSTLSAMLASPDEVSRAVALFMSSTETSRDSLVRMAVAGDDPQIYALAFNACAHQPSGACQMVSAGRWAELDPSNLVPWLHVAGAARQAQESATLDDAMHHVAQATRSDDGRAATLGRLMAFAPVDDSAVRGRLQLGVEVIGRYAALPIAYQSLTQHCSPTLQRDANRHQICAELARTMVERSDNLLERGIGVAIGRNAGWPAERIATLRLENQAWTNALVLSTVAGPGVSECRALHAQAAMIDEFAHHGEMGAARRAAERSGKTLAELARGP
jgi:hypothetical protein